MNFVKYTFEHLKPLGYFENNVCLMLSNAPKEHRRKLENFYCCEGNYKKFLNAFLKLKEELLNSKPLRKSFFSTYKDIVYNNICSDYQFDLASFYYLNVLMLSVFISPDGKFKIDNFTHTNAYTQLIGILANPDFNQTKTVQKIAPIVGDTKVTDQEVFIEDTLTLLFPYTLNIIEPSIFKNDISAHFYKEAADTLIHSREVSAHAGLHNAFCINSRKQFVVSVKLFSNISTRTVSEMEAIRNDDIIKTPYNRVGFLKPEFAYGQVDADPTLYKVKYKRTLHYNIDEVICKDGLVIKYTVYDQDFLVTCYEDYLRNVCLIHIMFFDTSMENTYESMQMTALLMLTTVMKKYAGMINSSEFTNPSVEIEDDEGESNHSINNPEKYTRKNIMIAPHRRKLPLGKVASPDKRAEAMKFNMELRDDETFVNSFATTRRILKSSSLEDENDVKFAIDL